MILTLIFSTHDVSIVPEKSVRVSVCVCVCVSEVRCCKVCVLLFCETDQKPNR